MSSEQVNRYDRQIRAWGFETQRKLQASKSVFIGLNHCSIECMKNLILAGAGEITIVTNEIQDNNDLKILESLNPNTKLNIVPETNIYNYDIICIFDNPELTSDAINSDRVVLLVYGISAYLLYKSPEKQINTEIITADPLHQTIVGALLSQMIVDNLPPIENPLALKLNFSMENLSANVSYLE